MKHSSHAAENQHVTLCRCLLQFLLLFCTQLMRRTSLSKRLENHTKTLLLSDVLPPIFTSPQLLQFLQRLAAALLIGMLFSVPASGGQPVNYAAARPRLSNLGPDEQFSRETGEGKENALKMTCPTFSFTSSCLHLKQMYRSGPQPRKTAQSVSRPSSHSSYVIDMTEKI